jgi:hypothetical protein
MGDAASAHKQRLVELLMLKSPLMNYHDQGLTGETVLTAENM